MQFSKELAGLALSALFPTPLASIWSPLRSEEGIGRRSCWRSSEGMKASWTHCTTWCGFHFSYGPKNSDNILTNSWTRPLLGEMGSQGRPRAHLSTEWLPGATCWLGSEMTEEPRQLSDADTRELPWIQRARRWSDMRLGLALRSGHSDIMAKECSHGAAQHREK